jgi:hypothetical protein
MTDDAARQAVKAGLAALSPAVAPGWWLDSAACAGPIATAVGEALCGSIPIITATMGTPSSLSLTSGNDRGGHVQFQGSHRRSHLV